MSGLLRVMNFIKGEKTGRVPFMPIFMRYAARHGKTAYRDFVLDAGAHCRANIECARAFGSDWVNVMSDPYAEAEAFGVRVEYPEDNLPFETGLPLASPGDVDNLRLPDIENNYRCAGRIKQLELFHELTGDEFLICGWVEGPVAEYCDLRGMGSAFLDFYDAPGKVRQAIDLILENARNFITAQIKAGARCIGFGDAACSQIGHNIYMDFAYEGEKMLVDHIHSLGAIAKLHICGNTTAIIPEMIRTGADIIDIDHLVSDMADFVPLLGSGQVFCGNLDPVKDIQNGTPDSIRKAVEDLLDRIPGKLIISGGCEITPDTEPANVRALTAALNAFN